jgi:hypothetical protein
MIKFVDQLLKDLYYFILSILRYLLWIGHMNTNCCIGHCRQNIGLRILDILIIKRKVNDAIIGLVEK